jgi:excisionase family DNA binding protein
VSEKYLSVRKEAQAGDVSYQTIWGMVRSGELPAIRIRNAIRIPESALATLPKYEPPKSGEGNQP